ncbi:DUF5590 domain-containing protein [Cohnella sp. GCM10027633]|uniref:cell wall elongation regulator TseB-like domain-containing protein n=1 Tax=unclassified Cohnella TaxID=2636738 RepID=UPI003637E3DE
MNLSRSESLRKIPRISWARWIIVIAGFIVFVIVSFVLYVRSADSDYRRAEERAIKAAKQQGGLAEIDGAELHTWQENVWIVTGDDEQGETWMIWERQTETLKLKVSENVSKSRMIAKFAETHGGRKPNRILPGWFQGVPAWEVRYWSETGKRHEAIDFYAFKDGAKLKTYELPTQRS